MEQIQQQWTWVRIVVAIIGLLIGQIALADNSMMPKMPEMPKSNMFSSTVQAKQLVATAGQLNHYPDSVIAVAGTVNLTENIPSNAIILAGRANLGGHVGSYVVTSAGKINFNAIANKSAVLFGGTINSSPDSVMHEGGFIIGGDINLKGNAGQDVTVIGGKVNLSGQFAGNVAVVSGQLTVSPNTKINGKLNYVTAGSANISSRADISGGAHAVDPQALAAKQQAASQHVGFMSFHWVFQLVQLLVVLMVLAAVCRSSAHSASIALRTRPLACLGYGVLVVFVGLLAVPILVATVIGTYLALLWGLTYAILLLLGYLYFAQSIGLLLVNIISKGSDVPGYWKTVLAGFLGLIIILLFSYIPVAGTWLVFVSVLLGVGTIVCKLSHCCGSRQCGS